MILHDSVADSLVKTCGECGETYGATEVRWHMRDGTLVEFGPGTTQHRLDAAYLRCELCQEDVDEW